MPAAPYVVSCECGAPIPVEKSAAGSQVTCRCGTTVKVPRLSELRRAAGEEAFVRSTIDRIEQQIRNDEIPLGEVCLLSMRPTREVIHVRVECEMPFSRGGISWWGLAFTAAFALMCSWLFAVYYLLTREPAECHGREVVVRVPLRISSDCQPEFRKLRPARVKELLTTVPIYAQLLAEYPRAKVYAD
jgi:hypothetical protein